jgi:uncharacterized membrane protein
MPILTLALVSLICCAMAVARASYTGRFTYLFFCWNLALAWVPLVLSLALVSRYRDGRTFGSRSSRSSRSGRFVVWTMGALWLIFFPNAPYIVTDLIHLRARSPIPLWLDALMIFAFALTGLCIAFVSLLLVHRLIERRRGARIGWTFVAAVAGLTGFGVYLGRFQRWNSWDLVSRPGELLADAATRILHPLSHPGAVGMTVIFGGFFAVFYLLMFALTRLGLPAAEAGRRIGD